MNKQLWHHLEELRALRTRLLLRSLGLSSHYREADIGHVASRWMQQVYISVAALTAEQEVSYTAHFRERAGILQLESFSDDGPSIAPVSCYADWCSGSSQ